MTDTLVLEQQQAQRKAAKRATLEILRAKKPRTSEVEVALEEGADPVSFLFVAIPPDKYDALVTEHPPTAEQLKKDANANVNGDTFPAALLAQVCAEPKLSVEEWTEIFTSDAWSGGERMSLYWEANSLCNRGLDLTPIAAG